MRIKGMKVKFRLDLIDIVRMNYPSCTPQIANIDQTA